MEESKKGKLNIILVIIIIILLGISGYLSYDKFFKENKKEETNTDNVLKVYGKDGNVCKEQSQDCNDVVATLKVNNKDASILYIEDQAGYVLYLDDKIKMYDLKTENVKELDISFPKNFNSKNLSLEYSKNGLIYCYSDYANGIKEEYYYDLENDKKLFSGYNGLYIVDGYGGYVVGTQDSTYYLLDTKTGQEVISRKSKEYVEFHVYYYGCVEGNAEHVIFSSYLRELVSEPYGYIIYNKDGTIRKELADDETIAVDNCQNGNDIYIYKKTKTYTFDGEEVK